MGTTDTPVTGLAVGPRPLHEEVSYLEEHVGRYLERRPRTGDIRSIFAGLRPLLRGRAGVGDGQALAGTRRGRLRGRTDHHHWG